MKTITLYQQDFKNRKDQVVKSIEYFINGLSQSEFESLDDEKIIALSKKYKLNMPVFGEAIKSGARENISGREINQHTGTVINSDFSFERFVATYKIPVENDIDLLHFNGTNQYSGYVEVVNVEDSFIVYRFVDYADTKNPATFKEMFAEKMPRLMFGYDSLRNAVNDFNLSIQAHIERLIHIRTGKSDDLDNFTAGL